jgi:hypothetical protein
MAEEYKASWQQEVTDCCGVSPEYGGSYAEYYKKCPKCGDGSLFWPARTRYVYHPSSYEQNLEDRIKSLEQEFHRHTVRLA